MEQTKFTLIAAFIICILIKTNVSCQEGIQLNTEEASNSYALFENFEGSFLINNCGEIVHQWPQVRFTENHGKILPNGNIIFIDDNGVYERDWDDNLISYTTTNETNLKLDYEVIVLENGNYLCIARRLHDTQFFIDNGYDPSNIIPMYNDAIVELVPVTGEIVWEWNVFDHVIQQRNSSAGNFGIIADNPGLLDVDVNPFFDWAPGGESFMINGFDYNEDLDQIVVSLRKLGEIGIIDHSTTTEEAKGSSGGRYGKGGDFIYRWGNPQNYDRGSNSDQVLYYQHNPNWIKYGEYKDQLIIFNNGLERDWDDEYSTVEIINPPLNTDGGYDLEEGESFLPEETSMTYGKYTTNTFFYSDYTSGAVVLPNENILITVGREDRLMEIDPSGEIVWDYIVDNSSYIFRSEKYLLDYEAFEGKDLLPNGFVENPSSTYDCELYTVSTTENGAQFEVKLLSSIDNILLTEADNRSFSFECYDIGGNLIFKSSNEEHSHTVEKYIFNTGFYFFKIHTQDKGHISVLKTFID